MFEILVFFKPIIKIIRIQPIINDKPIGNPLKHLIFKTGYHIYMITKIPKWKIKEIGNLKVIKQIK